MNKTILLFAPYFVPRKRVGALRPYKFATHLSKLGWKVHVICFSNGTDTLSSIEQENLKNVQIHELNLFFDTTKKLSSSDLSNSNNPLITKKKSFKFDFTGFVDSLFPLDTWYPYLKFSQHRIEKLVKKINPDILWTTSDPWSGLMIGKKLKQKFNLPWIADLRDPWALCSIRSKRKINYARKIDLKLERKILGIADSIVFTSSETEKIYTSYYPEYADKIELLHNGYQIDKSIPSDAFISPFPIDVSQKRLLFFGKFRSSSPASSFNPVLVQLKTHFPESYKNLKVYHIGQLDENDSENAKMLGVFDAYVSLKATPYEYTQLVLKEADLLISVLNQERNQVMPTKFWDYLPSLKPILSIGTNEELASILKDTNLGKQFSFDDSLNAATFIDEMLNNTNQIEVNTTLIESFDVARISEKLHSICLQILKQNY